MTEIEVKGQRSCEIWQSLKKDLNAHGFVIIIRRKLIFGRMTEVHKGINTSNFGSGSPTRQGKTFCTPLLKRGNISHPPPPRINMA